MAYGTWKQTGGGGSSGKVFAVVVSVVVAAVLYGDRRQVAQVAGDAAIVAIAVIAAVVVLGIAGFVLVLRRSRREAEANDAYRIQQAAQYRAEVEERQARRLAAEQARALPAPQPVVQVFNVIDPALLAWLLNSNGQQPVQVIPAITEEVPR